MTTFGTPEGDARKAVGRDSRSSRARWLLALAPSLGGLSVLVFFLVLPLFYTAVASTLSDKQADLNAAQAKLSKLQGQFDQLTDKYGAAEARLAEIDDAIAAVKKDISRTNDDLGTAEAQLAQRVVSLYKDGQSPTPQYLQILFSGDDFGSILDRLALLGRLANQDQELFAQVKAHLQKSKDRQADLASKEKEQTETMAQMKAVQAELNDKMRDSAAEYRTLKAQVLALREAARKAAEAEAARKAAAAAAAAKAQGQKTSNGSGTKKSTVQPGSFVFPVDGPHSYSDTWGAPRSGGRTHKGTDIMSPKGTPAVACVSGTVLRTNPKDSGLGGITIWLRGSNGSSYYYAHLVDIASGIRAGVHVSAGQTIGWVGNTGNAAGGAYHLHFEIHPGGGGAVDPYATLRNAD